jgi:hypothetical protein
VLEPAPAGDQIEDGVAAAAPFARKRRLGDELQLHAERAPPDPRHYPGQLHDVAELGRSVEIDALA